MTLTQIYKWFSKSIIWIMLFVGFSISANSTVQDNFFEEESTPAIESSIADDVEWRMPDKSLIKEYRSQNRFTYYPEEVESHTPSILDDILGAISKLLEMIVASGIMGWILVLICAVVLVVLVVKLMRIDIRSLLGNKKIENLDRDEGNVHEMNFDDLINNALSSGDFRLAVRYLYLKNLKLLADKSIIDWKSNKTNYNYLYEIKDANVRSIFLDNTYVFDYVWYGEMQLDKEKYHTIEERMARLNKQLADEN